MRFSNNLLIFSLLVSGLAANSKVLLAADFESARVLSKLSLQELLSIKVRTATNTENSLNQAPASISVFTQQQIQRFGFETLDELLAFVPGFQVSRGENGGGSFTFSPRGRRSDEGTNRDILLLIDGSRINEPVTTGAFEQERQVSLHNVKKVEIIRGPGSALYGSNAFLAVVNIETDKEANYLLAGTGSLNQRRAELAFSESKDNWAYSISLGHYKDSGEDYPGFYEYWGYIDDTQDPTERNNLDLYFKFDDWKLDYRFSARRYDDFITLGAQLDELQRQKMQSEILRLSYQFKSNNNQVEFFAERQEGVFDYLTGLFPENPIPLPTQFGLYWTDGSTDALVGGNYREVTQNRVGLDGVWDFNESHRISYGFSARQEKTSINPFQGNWDAQLLEETGQYVPSPVSNFIQQGFWIAGVRFDLLNPESRKINGIYLQDEWRLNKDWIFIIGARNDDYEDFGDNLSIRSGLVYDKKDHYWKLLYGEAFRAPSFTETRAGIASGGISNPDLKPEIVKTLELIYGVNREDWSLSLSLYQNNFEDMIANVLVDDVVQGITAIQPQNIGDESGSGIEFEFNRKLAEDWHLTIGGDYLIDELVAQHVAKERLFSRINYQKEDFEINLSARYLGDVMARMPDGESILEEEFLEGYWLASLNTRWQYNQQTIIYAKVLNLFDQEYYSFTPQVGLESGLPGRGRSIQVGISYTY